MGNATSVKDHGNVQQHLNREAKEGKAFQRRRNAYLGSLLGSSVTKKSSPCKEKESKVSKGFFGNVLRESGQDRLFKKKKCARSKLKNVRHSEPPLNVDPLLQRAKNCHVTCALVPNEAINFEQKQQCGDGSYANYDVKIGRSYNDRLYPLDQRTTQTDDTTKIHREQFDNHIYENMDFYRYCKDKSKENATTAPLPSEHCFIHRLVNNECTNSHQYQKSDYATNIKCDMQFINHQSKVQLRDSSSMDSFLCLDSKRLSSPIASAEPLSYNSKAPSLFDAINALGEEFGSDGSGESNSSRSTSVASMDETFLSDSIYFSINELQNESTLNDYFVKGDNTCDVNEGEEYSYFSFYADVHANPDQSLDYAVNDDLNVSNSNIIRRDSSHSKNDITNIEDLNEPLFNHSTSAEIKTTQCEFTCNNRYYPEKLSLKDIEMSKSEPDIHACFCAPTYETAYENLSSYDNKSRGTSYISLDSQSSKSSNDYFIDSEFEDTPGMFSDEGFNHIVNQPEQRDSSKIHLSRSATCTQIYQKKQSSVFVQMDNAKKPPQAPFRRSRVCNSIHDVDQHSRARSKSVSNQRNFGKIDMSKKRPVSFGSSEFHDTSEDIINDSQESLYDESIHKDLTAYIYDHAPSIEWLAERRKAHGNKKYANKQYREALYYYKEAIELCPDCAAYYSNRSACYMMLGKYTEALADARECVRLDTEFVKGYLRVGKCSVALGDANAALSVLRHASELDSTKAVRDEITKAEALYKCLDEINRLVAKKDYRTALFHIDKALLYAVASQGLKISKAENLVHLDRFSEAETIVNDILQTDVAHVDAIYVRGLCLYYQDNLSPALTHFQHVLRLAPDHRKAKDVYKRAKELRQKKEAGNLAFNKSQWTEAMNLYTEALSVDPTNKVTLAKLYFNRATVKAKLHKFEASIKDCTEAVTRNVDYVKAFIRRGKSYQAVEKYEHAVRDFEKANSLTHGHEYAQLLREAKLELKKSKRKDYYKILGVSKTANDDELKKAYKKKALMHHPDRHSNASEKDRRDHEVKFQEIGEAYAILTDTKKKSMYDNGQDLHDCGEEYSFTDGGFDPTEIFQAFFSSAGGAGGPAFTSQGHGQQRFSFGGGAGMNFMG